MNEEEQLEEHSCDDNAIYYEFTEDGTDIMVTVYMWKLLQTG